MANEDRRIIIYPDYINSKRTVAQGRRIPLEAAAEWPTIPEMIDACGKGMGLEAQFEPKRYPRNWCVSPEHHDSYGRIRVKLRHEDGRPVNPDVATRRELMIRMADFVRRHPERHRKGGKAGADAGGSSSSAGAGGAGSSKAGGKSSKKKKK